ncbi:YraN family protein [Phenylobacterium immobile]|uniref:YraN family protein n=1 Tax=Phenylobacterium immobile TaxID=21 RepID=UPI000A81A2A5|nr:YraN family protein [Phenylobacterium immobile]
MNQVRARRGLEARRRGRAGEWRAALWLMAKGYRILGFRLKAAQAEIDLLAIRGRTLCIVEVKHRADIAQALEAVSADQRDRLRRAGLAVAQGRPSLRTAVVRLDLIALAPGRLPMHIPDAWKGA